MEWLPIDEWVERLAAIPEPEFRNPRLAAFIAEYGIRPDGLSLYCYYGKHYTRNLIYRSDLFEVLAICWDVGQISLPHDHGGQQCWMVTPIGRLRVENFGMKQRDFGRGTYWLTRTGSFDMDRDHPAQVELDAPVHRVLNLAEFGERAVSVHIYSRPYTSCEVYDLETGAVTRRELRYVSEFGRLCDTTEQLEKDVPR